MKKLPKLDLHGTQVMNAAQMKRIVGGDPVSDFLGYTCTEHTVGLTCMDNGKKGVCTNAGAGVFYCETIKELWPEKPDTEQ